MEKRKSRTVKAYQIHNRRSIENSEIIEKLAARRSVEKRKGIVSVKQPSFSVHPSLVIHRVSGNLKEAVQNVQRNEKNEIRQLSMHARGIRATTMAEYYSVKAVGKTVAAGVQGTCMAARYTRTIFQNQKNPELKESRATYWNYYKTKRELQQKKKNLRKLEKREQESEDKTLKDECKEEIEFQMKTLKEEIGTLSRRQKDIKKTLTKKRKSRTTRTIKRKSIHMAEGTVKELTEMPGKVARMLADDLDAEKITTRMTARVSVTIGKLYKGFLKMIWQSVKSVLTLLSPIALVSLFLIFMLYILFFSPLSTEFGINLFSNDMESSEIVRNAVTSRRQQLAEEFLMAEPDATVYFVTLDEDTVTDGNDFMKVVARNMYVSEIEMKDWLSDSDEGGHYLNYLAGIMCYRLTDEEAAVYPEENLEAYSGNIQSAPEPEMTRPESTQPGAGGGIVIGGNIGIGTGSGAAAGGDGTQAGHSDKKVVIGYHTTDWLLENHLLGELEDLYLNTTTIYTPAMYSIGRAFVEGGFISE